MDGIGGDFIVKDEALISALLSSGSVVEAAKECGCSKSTIYNRLKDPEFSEKYCMARMEVLKTGAAKLHGYLGTAIETLAGVMNNKEVPAQTRLNAAESIIRNCLKVSELVDIAENIRRIEAKLANWGK